MESLKLDNPHIIVMVGLPGSGKTFFTNQFARLMKLPVLSSDKLKMFGSERATLYLLQELFKTKSNFVYDGDASTKKLRNALNILARKNDYGILFVWVQTEPEVAKKRYETTTRRKDFDAIRKLFSPPSQDGSVIVISGHSTFPTQLKMVLGRLISERSKTSIPKLPSRDQLKRR